jgi:spoIIIJ-associated protein
MPLADKVAAAHKINSFLGPLLAAGGFKLKYRITVDPQFTDDRQHWEKPEILVEFAGPDSALLLDRGAEALRSFEMLTHEALKLGPDEHELVSFDCKGYRASRLSELKTAAQVAAERVRKTGMPYQFGAMSSRERRIVHLALRDETDLVTESAGVGPGRAVVLYPKDYKGKRLEPAAPMARSRR